MKKKPIKREGSRGSHGAKSVTALKERVISNKELRQLRLVDDFEFDIMKNSESGERSWKLYFNP